MSIKDIQKHEENINNERLIISNLKEKNETIKNLLTKYRQTVMQQDNSFYVNKLHHELLDNICNYFKVDKNNVGHSGTFKITSTLNTFKDSSFYLLNLGRISLAYSYSMTDFPRANLMQDHVRFILINSDNKPMKAIDNRDYFDFRIAVNDLHASMIDTYHFLEYYYKNIYEKKFDFKYDEIAFNSDIQIKELDLDIHDSAINFLLDQIESLSNSINPNVEFRLLKDTFIAQNQYKSTEEFQTWDSLISHFDNICDVE